MRKRGVVVYQRSQGCDESGESGESGVSVTRKVIVIRLDVGDGWSLCASWTAYPITTSHPFVHISRAHINIVVAIIIATSYVCEYPSFTPLVASDSFFGTELAIVAVLVEAEEPRAVAL
jgi:hypothetical protein